MNKGTIYFKGNYSPSRYDWMHFYELRSDASGIQVMDGMGNYHFYPWQNIERISYN